MAISGSRVLAIMAGVLAVSATPAAAAAPANDDFKEAIPIRLGQTVLGTTAGATHERGEPQHGPGTAAAVWYRFRSSRRVTVLLNTCRAEEDPVIAVYTGRSVRLLRVIDFNDDGCPKLGSRVSFTARPGRTYRIAVAEYAGGGGRFRLGAAAIDAPRNDDFVDARGLALGSSTTGTTHNATLELGEPAHGPHSVWFKLRAPAGEVVLNACALRPAPVIAVYTGRSVNRLSPGVAGGCRVTFEANPDLIYRIQVSGDGAGGNFRLSVRRGS